MFIIFVVCNLAIDTVTQSVTISLFFFRVFLFLSLISDIPCYTICLDFSILMSFCRKSQSEAVMRQKATALHVIIMEWPT